MHIGRASGLGAARADVALDTSYGIRMVGADLHGVELQTDFLLISMMRSTTMKELIRLDVKGRRIIRNRRDVKSRLVVATGHSGGLRLPLAVREEAVAG